MAHYNYGSQPNCHMPIERGPRYYPGYLPSHHYYPSPKPIFVIPTHIYGDVNPGVIRKKKVHKTSATPPTKSTIGFIVLGVVLGTIIVSVTVAVVAVILKNQGVKPDTNTTNQPPEPPITMPAPTCKEDYVYYCNETDKCLYKQDMCNSYVDCPNQYDEIHCNCSLDQYKCNASRCLDDVFLCDGVDDCPDGDDETHPTCVTCQAGQFKCERNNTCIDLKLRCDGAFDCLDRTDEMGCLNLESSGNLVMATRTGNSSLYTCVDGFNKSMENIVCAMNGFKESTASTNVSLTDVVQRNNYLFVEGINNSLTTPIVNSRFVSTCSGLLSLNCSKWGCGTRSPGRDYGQYIINGYRAVKGAWPWQALLQTKNQFCGAVLIDKRFVLTAAHCVNRNGVNVPVSDIEVYLGAVELSDPQFKRFQVEKMTVHAGYNSSIMVANVDIALLKLSTEVTYSNFISPICLSEVEKDIEVKYRTCVSTGFGMAAKDKFPRNLLQTRLNLRLINDTIFVFSIPGIDRNNVCSGDSGGPFSCMNEQGTWFLVGIHHAVFTVDGQNYVRQDHRNCQIGIVANVAKNIKWIADEKLKL